MVKKILFLFVFIFIFSFQSVRASYLTIEEQRREFISAEQLIKKNKDSLFFSRLPRLIDYPLYPYLQYQWLKINLHESNKIKVFLDDYSHTRYADRLRVKWQVYLAKHKQWQEFINQYRATNNTVLQCHYYRAKYNTGAKKEALLGARKLWVVGKSQPSECDPIFKVLKNSAYFTREILWQRFSVSLKNGKVQLAKYIAGSMNSNDKRIAQRWLKVHSNPSLVDKTGLLSKNIPQAGLIFAHGIDRLARTDVVKAIEIWDAQKYDYVINTSKFQSIEQRLAMALAFRKNKSAYSRLSRLENPDEKAKEWRVRSALAEQNWSHVEQSIERLNDETKKEDKWRYWLARALENTNQPKIATFMFTRLAKERSFYGFLSADKLNKSYQLSDHPIQVTDEIFRQFKEKTDFRVVAELIAVNKPWEARRQWWYAVKNLDREEKIIAAKYAQQLQWKQIAILTVAKAKHWDDISIRFPTAFEEQVYTNAEKQALNPAVIFGLIRRESAFRQDVKSSAGALGLMQIMPRTGRQIAKQLKEKWRSKAALLNPVTNLKYGSYYFKRLLKRFNGHYALATAAYNAGPNRVKSWLPKNNNLAADVWVETIPFKETRAYVSAVLTYALIYQKKLKTNGLSMKEFMRRVFPR